MCDAFTATKVLCSDQGAVGQHSAVARGAYQEFEGAAFHEVVEAGEPSAPVGMRYGIEGHPQVVLVVAQRVESAEAARVGKRVAMVEDGGEQGIASAKSPAKIHEQHFILLGENSGGPVHQH